MKTYRMDNLKVTLRQAGSARYMKASYPVRYGLFSAVENDSFLFLFNLNGEVKYITGKGADWPHPAEWLKRTHGNDWVYYSSGSYYTGVVDLFGEFYLPCPAYPSNSLFKENPFGRQGVRSAIAAIERLGESLPAGSDNKVDREVGEFLALVRSNSPAHLQQRAGLLHRILQARVSVLPPDTRHADYDVIPLMIAEGCLYNCSFCEIKTGMELTSRTRLEIVDQLESLKEYFGDDLQNYNSIYLGQHDALAAHPDDIIFAAEQGFRILEIGKSYMKEPKLFLFGSAESFLDKNDDFWRRLNRLPFYTYINLGFESFDAATLELLKKPVGVPEMQRAFRKMLGVNRDYEHIEITGNFVLGDKLPAGHVPALLAYLDETLTGTAAKGAIYMSPLKGSRNTKDLLEQFRTIKQKSRMQAYLYLIQRL